MSMGIFIDCPFRIWYTETKAAAPHKMFHVKHKKENAMKTGIQLSSLCPLLTSEEALFDTLKRLGNMGCDLVQLQWIDRRVSIFSIKEGLRRTGIESVSVQDLFQAVQAEPDYYLHLNQETGGTWLCVSRIPMEYRSRDGLQAFVGELSQLSRKAEQMGQRLCFHPVRNDFHTVDGIDPVTYLLEEMPDLEIAADLYHLSRERDMKLWLRQYTGRVCMVHFKDADGDNQLVPPGQGVTDWTGIQALCSQIGVEYAFVEQEQWQGDPFLAMNDGLDWLNRQSF